MLRHVNVLFILLSGACCHARHDDHQRKLQVVTTLPNTTKLTIGTDPAISWGSSATLAAGAEYPLITIDVTMSGATFGAPFIPTVRLVQSTVNDTQAAAGACVNETLPLNISVAPFGGPTGTMLNMVDPGFIGHPSSILSFLMGGSYKICYSDDGTFSNGHADILDFKLLVNGVVDSCTLPNCLATTPYRCQVRQLASSPAGSCTLQFEDFTGPPGMLTWTPAFSNVTYDANGQLQTWSNKTCAGSGEQADQSFISTDGVDRFITSSASSAYKQFSLPQTSDALVGSNFTPFTVAACYCPLPSQTDCDTHSEYTQQVGLIYFYLAKICGLAACTVDYVGVLRKVNFIVKVECPPLGCNYSTDNRIKLITSHASNDLPSWNTSSGCGTALHSDEFEPVGNCVGATDCMFSGGERQDYKLFSGNSTRRFSLPGDPSSLELATVERYDLRNYHHPQQFDVCFCNELCSSPENWVQVGTFRVSPVRLVGHSRFGQLDNVKSVEHVLTPGMIGLARDLSESTSLGMRSGGLLKVLKDDNMLADDVTCASSAYDASLVIGPSSSTAAKEYSAAAFSNKLIFDGGVASRQITIQRAGIIAICYCGVVGQDGSCFSDDDFKIIARLTIKGPSLGQSWEFSVGIVSRMTYQGWGLQSHSRLRIISASGSCSSNNGNPKSQDPVIYVGCPDACSQVVNLDGFETDLSTQVTSYNQALCNSQNVACNTVYLQNINTTSLAHATALKKSRTILTFSPYDPMFADGDVIALQDTIQGGTEEQRATMRGVFPFADSGTYMTGLRVQRHGQPGDSTYSVPIGWLAGETPTFKVPSGMGRWTRHNVASTKEEILGTAERQNMKVCWAAHGSTYLSKEIGTVSFLNPPVMKDTTLNLVSPIIGQSVPVILSFRTGTQLQYANAQATELRIRLLTVDFLQVDFVDGSTISSSQSMSSTSASRSVCGTLFSELWSSDDRGFPYPANCSYTQETTRDGVKSREFLISFESFSGLAADVHYQIVMRATASSGIRAGDEVLQLFSMDDSASQPYKAIELGRMSLARTPLTAAMAPSPMLESANLHGAGDLLTLASQSSPLQLELHGSLQGPVVAGSHLRLAFKPFTLWQLGKSCVATCTAGSAMELCGDIETCEGEKLVREAHNSLVHMKLPSQLTPITGNVRPTIALWGLKQPPQGFFPTRLGVQISSVVDDSPQYLESGGAYLFREARGNGQTVGSVVTSDGNSKPFMGSVSNDLYLRIAFATTLFSKVSNEAHFTITLPDGYTCNSASTVESTLNILQSGPSPQRRGALSDSLSSSMSDGTWSLDGRSCHYHLLQNSVIYAGAIVYIKLMVNNPDFALDRQSPLNKFNLSVYSRGEMTYGKQSMPSIQFGANSTGEMQGNLAGSVAVLGKLSDLRVQPSNFAVGILQNVKIFFRTGNPVGLGAAVVIAAPDKFDFGLACLTSDLSDTSVYNVGAIPATLRLPGIVACSGSSLHSNAAKYNHASVKCSENLLGNTNYAFEIVVRNPTEDEFSLETLSSWHLTTVSSNGDVVDSSDETLQSRRLSSDPAAGWGLYLNTIDTSKRFTVSLSSWRPYSMSLVDSTVTIFPIQVPSTITSKLRITAPGGYIWILNSPVTNYKMHSVTGATGDLPGGLPSSTLKNSALAWVAATYNESEVYGFITAIRVPDMVSTISANSFFIELGDWDSGDISTRFEAGVSQASLIHALQDAAVSYTSDAEQMFTTLTLQLRTITTIPTGGGFLFVSPPGFDIDESCSVSAAAGSLALPSGIICEASLAANLSTTIFTTTSNTTTTTNISSSTTTSSNSTTTRTSTTYSNTTTNVSSTTTTIANTTTVNKSKISETLQYVTTSTNSTTTNTTTTSTPTPATTVTVNSTTTTTNITTLTTTRNVTTSMTNSSSATKTNTTLSTTTTNTTTTSISVTRTNTTSTTNTTTTTRTSSTTNTTTTYTTNTSSISSSNSTTTGSVTTTTTSTTTSTTSNTSSSTTTSSSTSTSTSTTTNTTTSTTTSTSTTSNTTTATTSTVTTTRRMWPDSNFNMTEKGPTQILIRSTEKKMMPGLYRLRIGARTPNVVMNNPIPNPSYGRRLDTSTRYCGYESCWLFDSFDERYDTESSLLDMGAAAPSFSIFRQMSAAGLAQLSAEQRWAIRQNDRPGYTSSLIFFFQLSRPMYDPGPILLRGPVGTLFRHDCLHDVVVQKSQVFGSLELWPAYSASAPFTAWPDHVAITDCVGQDNAASIHVEAGFEAGKMYPFRIQLQSTPPSQPDDNVWTVHCNMESSPQFPSFDLSTFSSVSLVALTQAQSPAVPQSAPTVNVITLTFHPVNSVSSGLLQLEAPPGFKFEHKQGICTPQLQSFSASANLAHDFGLSDFDCLVNPSRDFVMLLEMGVGVTLVASTRHVLTAMIQNPVETMHAGSWLLQTLKSKSTDLDSVLDEIRIKSFAVVPVMPVFSVVSVSAGEAYNSGLSPVAIHIQATVRLDFHPGDTLYLISPLGFDFAGTPPSQCNGFQWDAASPSVRGVSLGSSNQMKASCAQGTLTITHSGGTIFPVDSHISFHVLTTNPRQTPKWAINFWRFEQRRGMMVRAAGAVAGYRIIPQLENINIALVGPLQAMKAKSTLSISFRVVLACDAIRIEAIAPVGFDFSNAVVHAGLDGGPMSEVNILLSSALVLNSVDINVIASSEQTVALTLSNVQLGSTGGVTKWSIKSFSGGIQNDELQLDGFRLPGLVSVIQSQLRNELDSELGPIARSSSEVSLMSDWVPRVRSQAIAEFWVRLSSPVPAMTELHVVVDLDYIFNASDVKLFPYNASGNRKLIGTQNHTTNVNTTASISLQLLESLLQDKDYVILLPLTTASSMASKGHWRLELRDTAALPLQTNDGQFDSFPLVEIFAIGISTAYAPPAATIHVTVNLNLGVATPTILRVYPPLTYGVPSNCSDSFEVQCSVSTVGDRTLALLSKHNQATFSANVVVQLKVVLPASDPVSRAWLIEGLVLSGSQTNQVELTGFAGSQVGWGEDRQGFQLTPMSNVVARYAAVPLLVTFLSIELDIASPAGTRPVALRIIPPRSYRLACTEKYLNLISMPTYNASCSPDPFTLKLLDGAIFPSGRQFFTLEVRVPSATPTVTNYEQYFRVSILDGTNAVLASNTEVPATLVVSSLLQIDQALLAWTSSIAGSESLITFGFKLKRSIPPSGQSGGGGVFNGTHPVRVAALLLTMPNGFAQSISVNEDVKNDNGFPVPEAVQWADWDTTAASGTVFATGGNGNDQMNKLRILRDETRSVPVGTFTFQLPVIVPVTMPAENIWYVSLCSTVGCSSIDDSSVVLSFVVPGFVHGELSASANAIGTHSFAHGIRPVSLWWTLLVWLLVSSLRFV